jgi:hypothetical protein
MPRPQPQLTLASLICLGNCSTVQLRLCGQLLKVGLPDKCPSLAQTGVPGDLSGMEFIEEWPAGARSKEFPAAYLAPVG